QPLIETRGLTLAHTGAPVLRDVDFAISPGEIVTVVGPNGSGKSTLVKGLIGALEPNSGVISRAPNLRIGYVPQTIFLTDDSVAANIALGVPPERIDHAAVMRAAKTAELHEFVMREMPEGYATAVGERGVRLSGGQRQRIGIARALYHDPDVLILDEATSALDNITERVVMQAVHNLGRAKTIIMIAHRLSTVRDCDTIYVMEGGRVAAQGSYDRLLAENPQFRAMVGTEDAAEGVGAA
ncbi:MAG: ATP-binding cassette domain-containing protein, partial [Pseudomonadota bacterium]